MSWAGTDCLREEAAYEDWFENQKYFWREEDLTEWRVEQDMAVGHSEYLRFFTCWFKKNGDYFKMLH